MQCFYIMPNLVKEHSYILTKQITEWLVEHNCQVLLDEEVGELYDLTAYIQPKLECLQKADIVIVLGGDGTILNAAREIAHYQIPMLGVNIGNFGFLAEVEAKDVLDILALIINGDYHIEERMMLEAKLITKDRVIPMELALNDVVASRASISRMVGFSIYVNGTLVNNYEADGIIISTPTGSTAYNLSAGGPILSPMAQNMVITPICPHSLTARSIVLCADDEVTISFDHNRNTWEEDLKVTIDGQRAYELTKDMDIVIRKSEIKTILIKHKKNDFFSILRKKMESK